ncbi:class I SAM-dependent methyltransferase [Anaeromyxobacter sp. Fw109-5]|uniref:class I SAM-dependent methyltransferase n=1 Tax=Anaeromyxobacter sp. (strain Fw109-5) TaxID=404589 RepID=UPI0002E98569|nr:class I SAM-dependent methyltransferase [Anaeromyxobacter sp. Fw109-5]
MNDAPGEAHEETDMQAAETMNELETTLDREGFEPVDHAVRGRLNAWFLRVMDRHLHAGYGELKRELFGGLPRTIVELGAGAGANFRYLARGTHVIAIEPNRHMHGHLRAAAARHGVTVDVRTAVAERLPLPDASVDAVISSLVLCSVADPGRALAEVRRVLRQGGRFWCVEHVAAREGSAVARVQRSVKRPWGRLFEGCDTRRDVGRLLGEAGYASIEARAFTMPTAFVPIRPHLAAVAVR